MHHYNIIKELMSQKNLTLAQMAERINVGSHVAVLHRIQAKDAYFDHLLELLEALDYELVIRPKTDGELPDGEYALRQADYGEVEAEL